MFCMLATVSLAARGSGMSDLGPTGKEVGETRCDDMAVRAVATVEPVVLVDDGIDWSSEHFDERYIVP